ncbi:MAG: glycosyltransferase family 9 protein [Acetobacteraceae bacterium]
MPDARILVLKLGAFGNIVLSLGPFAAIRRHHPRAEITVLTTAPYAGWLASSPYFDHVLIDRRPAWWDIAGVLRLRRTLAGGRFDWVYDLQTSGRSSRYFRLFPRHARPSWSGIAPGCSHPDSNPDRNSWHDIERQREQLRLAGIDDVPDPDLSWCRGDIGRFGLPDPFALLVPGSSPNRPLKRWPAGRYAELAMVLRERGITPVVVGSRSESALAAQIGAAVDLTGQTSFGDLADLGRAARLAVGNDTGPMHLIATAGCASVVLFSNDSDPALCAPRGRSVTILRRPDLGDLAVEEVAATLPRLVAA